MNVSQESYGWEASQEKSKFIRRECGFLFLAENSLYQSRGFKLHGTCGKGRRNSVLWMDHRLLWGDVGT